MEEVNKIKFIWSALILILLTLDFEISIFFGMNQNTFAYTHMDICIHSHPGFMADK